jgi:dipeptidase
VHDNNRYHELCPRSLDGKRQRARKRYANMTPEQMERERDRKRESDRKRYEDPQKHFRHNLLRDLRKANAILSIPV